MRKQVFLIFAIAAAMILGGCGIYGTYERPEVNTGNLYRDAASTDTLSMGNMAWEEVFTDPDLQTLIREALENNTDLRTSALKVEEARAALMSSRLAFTPSLSLAPQGQIGKFGDYAAVKTYTLPATASWEIDIFGRLRNSKRSAKAAFMQTDAYRQAVRTQIIATMANTYYTLLMLDRQLSITEETSVLWQQTVETMKAMKQAGYVNEAAVVQSEANRYMIAASIPDLRRQIREVENSISLLLATPPQNIRRGTIEAQSLPEMLDAGVPVQMLSNRPDVLSAEMALAGAYYTTNAARSAFYPQLSLSGTFGWSNSSGSVVMNPAQMIASAVGTLVAPIFNKGLNKARLRMAKAQQEEALLAFQQSLLNAGAEVSNALYQYQSVGEKLTDRKKQIEALEKSVDYTKQLLASSGSTTYLEVLTAEQSLLNARLNGVSDEFQRIQAVVSLYNALGGGRGDATPATSRDKSHKESKKKK